MFLEGNRGTALVVAGIHVVGGRVLLARRRAGQDYPGLWEFPGGKVEPDETPEQALAREWQEEMGVTPLAPVPYSFWTNSPGRMTSFSPTPIPIHLSKQVPSPVVPSSPKQISSLTLLFFKVQALLGEPRAVGCDAVRRCEAAEARLLATPPADAPVLERLAAEGGGAFLDTEGPGAEAIRSAALERIPFIEGSESLSEGSVVKFRKQDLPGRPFMEGILVTTSAGSRAFENLCPHVPIPLDRFGDDAVLTPDGRYLACHNHGALFEPETGRCVSGPCEGDSLRAIPLRREGGGWAVET